MARILAQAGFRPVRQTGSHVRWRHPDGRAVTVPRHAGKDIRVGLIIKILRDAGLDRSDL